MHSLYKTRKIEEDKALNEKSPTLFKFIDFEGDVLSSTQNQRYKLG